MTRALIVTEPGDQSVLAVHDIDVPAPAAGEVQVKVAAIGVNFIDVYKRQGVYPVPTPFTLGEEAAGVVAAVGAGVRDFAVGDRVAWGQSAGSAAELANVPAHLVVPVPDGVELSAAAAAMLQGMTAHYLVNSTWRIEAGQVALVHAAAGGVGQLLVQMITARGATVVATAGSAEKLATAADLGANHVVNYNEFTGLQLAEEVRRLAGRGVDVAYDGVGKATFQASLHSLRPRGMMALFGGASGQVPPFDLQELNKLGSLFVTRPSLGAYLQDRKELLWRAGDVLDGIAAGMLQIAIGGTYPLNDAGAAYRALESRATTGKLLLVP